MDHRTLVFSSVFPVLSLSHTTPTPVATPDLGVTVPSAAFGSPYIPRQAELHDSSTHRQVKRTIAWSCATRFLSLDKVVPAVPRILHRTREVEDALIYLLVGEGRVGEDARDGEEALCEWYTNECRLHFASNVRPELDALWRDEVKIARAWDVLGETQRVLKQVQNVYLEPFNEHVLPFLGSAATTRSTRPGRRDEDEAERAEWKFRRDVHALFAHCVAPRRFSKTLGYVLHDAGCRLFRIYTRQDGVQPSALPENTTEVRQQMTTLLQGLERVGLGGESAQKAFAHAMHKLLDSFINSHYMKVDWYDRKSVVPHLKEWVKDGFCPLVELVLECLRCEQSSVLPTEVTACQEMALGRLGRVRVDNLFDFVIHWDKSLGAILDIKEYLRVTGAKQHVTSSFSQQVSRRLLHPGVTTTYILNVYIFIIRSFHELEPKGVLLERVARPIRRYLKEREDTGRIIISSLLTDLNDETGSKFSSNGELSYEIASEMAKPLTNLGQDADEELNWNDMNWQPLPQDASPEYKKSKVEDVIWFLLTLWERDDFINELKNILGDHLLRCTDPEYEKEIRLLELIKMRLGDSNLQAAEVMLRDVLDSKRINASIRAATASQAQQAFSTPEQRPRGPRTPNTRYPRTPQPRRGAQAGSLGPSAAAAAPGPTLNAQILSSFFWPLLRDDGFRVPAPISTLQETYGTAFTRIKGMRKLRWMNALGSGSITLDFADRTEQFDSLTPWQVSVVHAFQPQPGEEHIAAKVGRNGEGIARNVSQLEEMLDMDEALVRQTVAFWVGRSVLRETGPDTYAVIETLPKSDSKTKADELAAAAAAELAAVEAAQATAVRSQQDLFNENRDVYETFITSMLTAQGSVPVGRILMMMRMMMAGGFPFGEEEIAGLLSEMEGEGKVITVGGDIWGMRR
ncbi:anaphase-promoting complex subunit Apc2 [Didymella exigua CBS 183.55]|uniref:Anaphase-promoting complex subunit 2 n=1 Tax=Didymella exigua CBS 183.55 TaxID=1150837 RepID=A0A6A5RU41_9PLEO|nr:anaphase-promoting complex subunit Apc2 [Didymella exigua CBS 183.55]KAF1928877.1 anaphase-promoting complex subunit Apc2 [Didymella exigua CBS 183.55]